MYVSAAIGRQFFSIIKSLSEKLGTGCSAKVAPPKFSKYKIPCKMAQSARGYIGVLYLENLGGATLAEHPVSASAGW